MKELEFVTASGERIGDRFDGQEALGGRLEATLAVRVHRFRLWRRNLSQLRGGDLVRRRGETGCPSDSPTSNGSNILKRMRDGKQTVGERLDIALIVLLQIVRLYED